MLITWNLQRRACGRRARNMAEGLIRNMISFRKFFRTFGKRWLNALAMLPYYITLCDFLQYTMHDLTGTSFKAFVAMVGGIVYAMWPPSISCFIFEMGYVMLLVAMRTTMCKGPFSPRLSLFCIQSIDALYRTSQNIDDLFCTECRCSAMLIAYS
jgi:hypothetical protein